MSLSGGDLMKKAAILMDRRLPARRTPRPGRPLPPPENPRAAPLICRLPLKACLPARQGGVMEGPRDRVERLPAFAGMTSWGARLRRQQAGGNFVELRRREQRTGTKNQPPRFKHSRAGPRLKRSGMTGWGQVPEGSGSSLPEADSSPPGPATRPLRRVKANGRFPPDGLGCGSTICDTLQPVMPS